MAGTPGSRVKVHTRGLVLEQSGAEAASLGVAATGALGQQRADGFAGGLGVGGQSGQVAAVAVGRVERGEDVAQLAGELAAQTSRGAAALAEGDEVTQHVRVAQLAFAVIDEQIHRVAVRDDHAGGIVAEQRLRAMRLPARRMPA